MYLLVIVSLVIGLLGVYAQALSLQAARFAASQTGLALTMMMWHDAAVSMGASVVNTGQLPTTPGAACGLTYCAFVNALVSCPANYPHLCPVPVGTGMPAQSYGTVTNAVNSPNWIYNTKLLPAPGGVEHVHLPADYNTGLYQFYSILYRDASSQPFIVTFVQPPVIGPKNPAPGLLKLPPTAKLINLGMGDLLHQLQISGLPSFTYGTVKTSGGNSTLWTTGFRYVMPNNAVGPGGFGPIIDDGSAAIISSPAGF